MCVVMATFTLGEGDGIALGEEEGIALGEEEGIALGEEEGITLSHCRPVNCGGQAHEHSVPFVCGVPPF